MTSYSKQLDFVDLLWHTFCRMVQSGQSYLVYKSAKQSDYDKILMPTFCFAAKRLVHGHLDQGVKSVDHHRPNTTLCFEQKGYSAIIEVALQTIMPAILCTYLSAGNPISRCSYLTRRNRDPRSRHSATQCSSFR